MDTELLKTFLAVQQTGHFGRAAEALFLTQAAVSARIKLLESALGSPVFARYRNNLQLTDTGKRLIPHARSVLAAWDVTLHELVSTATDQATLSIGAPFSLWESFVQQTLQSTLADDDGPQVQADAMSPDQLNRRLLDRTLDLAFQFEQPKHSDIRTLDLPPVNLILVASEPRDLADATALSGYIELDWGVLPGSLNNLGRTSSTRLQTGLVPLALDLLLRQGGCAYLPAQRVAGYLDRLLYRIAGADVCARPVVACYHQHNKIKPLVLRVIEQARAELQSASHPVAPE
ncbi:MAG: DNA-binding transcriptional LysR family regulator [Granulosicoccus sp.]|jgi:DNA-binding transcriptional LysR family regulator